MGKGCWCTTRDRLRPAEGGRSADARSSLPRSQSRTARSARDEFRRRPCILAIREDVWALYHRGKYDTAVFEAMKAVEVAVREASGLAAKDIGAPLMRRAFDVNGGPLTDATAEPAERQALSDLFAGTIGTYKMLSRTERSDSTIRTRRPRSLCSQTTFSESWTADARPEVRHESARRHHRH